MEKLLAGILSMGFAYLPSAVFGDAMSPATEVVVSTIVGLLAYGVCLYYLRKVRGGY